MGFLDGDIANLVGSNLIAAGLSKPATLIKVIPGARSPGAVSAGTNPSTVSHAVQGIAVSTTPYMIAGTLIAGVDRVIKLYGSTIPPGVVPAPGDRITIDGATATIVNDDGGKRAVAVDAAGAVYTCQCRG
jgi:hypothetical protein